MSDSLNVIIVDDDPAVCEVISEIVKRLLKDPTYAETVSGF